MGDYFHDKGVLSVIFKHFVLTNTFVQPTISRKLPNCRRMRQYVYDTRHAKRRNLSKRTYRNRQTSTITITITIMWLISKRAQQLTVAKHDNIELISQRNIFTQLFILRSKRHRVVNVTNISVFCLFCLVSTCVY